SDLQFHLFNGNDLLPFEMAASFWRNLVFENNPRCSGRFKFRYGTLHLVKVSVTGVTVRDQGDGEPAAGSADLVRHLGERQEVEIGETEEARRNSEATHENGLESGLLHEHRGKYIVGAKRLDDAGPVQKFAQPCGATGIGNAWRHGSDTTNRLPDRQCL